MWVPPERIYRHLHFNGQFRVELAPGVSFKMMSQGAVVENELFWRGYAGSWERESLDLWRLLAPRARNILDVGANTGVFALAAQALNPSAKILAIEPSPRVFARLQQNIALNGFPILAAEVAASDKAGTAPFYDFEGAHQYSASLDPGMGGTILTEVPIDRLDDLIDRFGFSGVDLMKIDVEMHEPAALRGMRRILERSRPTIMIEILNDNVEQGVREAIDGLDYRWTKIADDEARNFLLQPTSN